MCQITAPPAVFLASPLHAPLGWLFIAGFLAAAVIGVPYTDRKYLRQHPSALYRRVGLALIGSALLALCTGLVTNGLVVDPSSDALYAWLTSQHVTLNASHCALTASTALGDAYDRHHSGPIETWQNVDDLFLWVGGGAAFISSFWSGRRPRAQHARQ